MSDHGPYVGRLPNSYPTTGGAFSLASAGSVTFDATLSGVPEPLTWAILTLGVGALSGVLRRRGAKARSLPPSLASLA